MKSLLRAAETVAYEYKDVFSLFLELPHGIPSHDTMQRVMSALNGENLNRLFVSWLVEKIEQKGITPKIDLEREVISIDGKTARGSKNDYHKAVHIASAFCANNSINIWINYWRVSKSFNKP